MEPKKCINGHHFGYDDTGRCPVCGEPPVLLRSLSDRCESASTENDIRYISVLGDSISTFSGYHPQNYSVYYDETVARNHSLFSVDDTWWMKVIRHLDGTLLKNDSYSGSRVTGIDFPAGNCQERIEALSSNHKDPDVILVFLGMNDFGYGVRIKKKSHFKSDCFSFSYAYELMIKRIRSRYPDALVVCGTLMQGRIKHRSNWHFPASFGGAEIDEYNNIIRLVCRRQNVYLADLADTSMSYETLDSVHPTAEGHSTIASAWISCLDTMSLSTPAL